MKHQMIPPNSEMLSKVLPKYNFTQEERDSLATDLIETCIAYRGLGLSANQVGIEKRAFCIMHGDYKELFFNPEIVSYSEETNLLEEGCLSYPGVFVVVKRSAKVTIKYEDVSGQPREQTFSGLTARIVQHEYDHMEGKNYLDQVSLMKKALAFKKARKKGYRV